MAQTQKQLDNLKKGKATQFKKGQSGNPKGGKKGIKTINDILKWVSETDATDAVVRNIRSAFNIPARKKITIKEALLMRSIMKGLAGDVRHLNFWAERLEGKVPDKVEVESRAAKVTFVEKRLPNPEIITINDTEVIDE